MDESLERNTGRTLKDPRTEGRDHLAQFELAVRARVAARPGMIAADALAPVDTPAEMV
jgi:hypothetical protein